MANQQYISATQSRALAVNKLIRNTYTLLALTFLFSAFTATVSVFLRLPPMTNLLAVGGAFLLIWLVLPRTANSAAGLGVVFAITGLLGLSLGPILTMYLSLSNGPSIVATALGGTAVNFFGQSG
jgi:modulator of FtsH protease